MPGIHNGNLFVECMNLLCYLVLLKLLHMEHHGSQIFFAHVIQFRRRKLLHNVPSGKFSYQNYTTKQLSCPIIY